MDLLLQLDLSLFRFINEKLAHPFLDTIMSFASGNVFFMPSVVLACLLLAWRGRTRGVVCVAMVLLVIFDGKRTC